VLPPLVCRESKPFGPKVFVAATLPMPSSSTTGVEPSYR